MSTSIPVLNKNHSLPPLLLPASRPVEGIVGSSEVRRDPFSGNGSRSGSSSSCSSNRSRSSSNSGIGGNVNLGVNERKRGSDNLEGLMNLATMKRARADATAAAAAVAAAATATATANASGLPSAVHPQAPYAKSESVSSVSSVSSSVSDSAPPSHVGVPGSVVGESGVGTIQRDHFVRGELFRGNGGSGYVTEKNDKTAATTTTTPPPPPSTCTTPERGSPRSSASGPSSSGGKRQRVGPSCDGCRLKKIKCDAQVEILVQNPQIISQVTRKLHHIVTRDDVARMTVKVDLSAVPKDCVLVKHIDKIVMFRPCTSCNKRRVSLDGQQVPLDGKNNVVTGGGCVFSKGFTRADINVFTKICKRIGERRVQEMTIDDYHEAGF